jgi:hypothetical protein
MNKEQQELIDEAYANYITLTRIEFNLWLEENPDTLVNAREDTKELFLQSIKEDKHWFTGREHFSEKWGLKVEERELGLKERVDIFNSEVTSKGIRTQIAIIGVEESYWLKSLENIMYDIPTKLITVTYKDKTLTSYE